MGGGEKVRAMVGSDALAPKFVYEYGLLGTDQACLRVLTRKQKNTTWVRGSKGFAPTPGQVDVTRYQHESMSPVEQGGESHNDHPTNG
jgi:hypothetical protein